MLWIYIACSITHLCQDTYCPLGYKEGGGEHGLPHGQREQHQMKWCKGKENTHRLNQGWRRCSFKSEGESSWEATFPWIHSRSSIWRAALAACVSKEWIQHIINNWCASKHWRYAHMMRMYPFSSGWFILSQRAVNLLITLDKGNITFFSLVISAIILNWITVQVDGKKQSRNAPCDKKARLNPLVSLMTIVLRSAAHTHRRWIFHSVWAATKWWNKQEHVMFRNTNYYIKGLRRCWQSRPICSKQTLCLN